MRVYIGCDGPGEHNFTDYMNYYQTYPWPEIDMVNADRLQSSFCFSMFLLIASLSFLSNSLFTVPDNQRDYCR